MNAPGGWGFCGYSKRYLGAGAPASTCVMAHERVCARGDCIRDRCHYYEERSGIPRRRRKT